MYMHQITVPESKSFNIILMGDVHLGNSLVSLGGFDRMCEFILRGTPEDTIVIHHGDQMEGIFIDDKRYEANIHNVKNVAKTGYTDGPDNHPNMFSQVEDSVRMLEPIAPYIRAMNDGNHSRKLVNIGNMQYEVCKRLGIPYVTWSSVSEYVTPSGETVFKHFHSHGFGTIKSKVKPYKRAKTNMEISLRQRLEDKMGDCILMSMGHTHQLLVHRPDPELFVLGNGEKLKQYWIDANYFMDRGVIPSEYRWYVNTGSFLKLYGKGVSGYAEVAGYDPIPLGFAVCMVRNGRIEDIKRISAEKSGLQILPD